MATMDGHAPRFIGNDIVVPRITRRLITKPKINTEPKIEPAEMLEGPWQPPVAEMAAVRTPIEKWDLIKSKRFSGIRWAIIVAVSLLVVSILSATALTLTRANALKAIDTETSKLALTISDKLHKSSTFHLPAYSILVHSSSLSSDINSIEQQQITLNLGTTALSPTPSDISSWVKTSAGPQSGSTILTVNTANVSSYIANLIKQNAKAPINETKLVYPSGKVLVKVAGVNGVSFGGNQMATNQIAKALFSVKGTTVTLPTTSVPFQTTVSSAYPNY